MVSREASDGRKPLILVVDDDGLLCATVGEILLSEGYELVIAADGKEAWEHLSSGLRPRLVLSDVRMPGMDGYELLGAMRRSPELCDIPFVFLSEMAGARDIRRGLSLGADDYIPKPFEPDAALKSIRLRIARAPRPELLPEERAKFLRSWLPHEYRTPLMGILGFASLMRDSAQTGSGLSREEIEEFTRSILESGNRLLRMFENLALWLELSDRAGEPGAHRIPAAAVYDWPEAVEAAAHVRATHHGRERDLRIDLAPCGLHIPEGFVDRVVLQLVDNACKFSATGTPVELTGRPLDSHYVITVSDRGRRMTDEQIARVSAFRQFERESWEQQGLGLGLAICRLFAACSGGRFTLIRNGNDPGLQARLLLRCPRAR